MKIAEILLDKVVVNFVVGPEIAIGTLLSNLVGKGVFGNLSQKIPRCWSARWQVQSGLDPSVSRLEPELPPMTILTRRDYVPLVGRTSV